MENLFIENYDESIVEFIKEKEFENFEFLHSTGTIKHQFLKREIPVKIEGKTYYDLVTPYSYGGPIITECDEKDKWELVDEFQRTFQAYCKKNNIICEFVRFNPLISNAVDFVCCYELECIGEIDGSKLANLSDSFGGKDLLEYKEENIIAQETGLNFLATQLDQNAIYQLCVGKKVWNNEIYKKTCRAAEVGIDGDFFPAYRKKKLVSSSNKV